MSFALRSRRHGGAPTSPVAADASSPPRRSARQQKHPSGKDKERYREKWVLAVTFASLLGLGLWAIRRERIRAEVAGMEPPVQVKIVDGALAGVKQAVEGAARRVKKGQSDGAASSHGFDGSASSAAGGAGAAGTYDSSAAAEASSFPLPADDPNRLTDHLGKRLHVVFSTDCSTFQHWQSYLMFYSALRVGQPGKVTRIASGCSDEDGEAEMEWHNRHIRENMSPRFGLHLTPHFSAVTDDKGEDTGKEYKFFNKPFGLKHWIENGEGMGIDPATGKMRDEDVVVILIDPDMALLRPITSDFSDERETLVGREGLQKTRVEHGSPFGQTYGLGTSWMKFDLAKIAGQGSPALTVEKDDAHDHYPVGPPYLATARDMRAIATKWSEFAPRVHAQHPHLLAEMYAYCIAAAHLQLPHQKISSLMVSNADTGGEGWPLVDKIPSGEVCGFMSGGPDHSVHALPSVMHLCQRYIVGPWFFGKRKMPHDFFSCDSPLLEVPPPDLAVLYDYKIKPAEQVRVDIPAKVAHQDAFMMCGTIRYLNEAGTYFKRKGCLGTNMANYAKTLNLFELFRKKNKK